MAVPILPSPKRDFLKAGLKGTENIHYQSSSEELVQDTLRLQQGQLSQSGALVIHTGEFTGRAPEDRFFVRDDITDTTIDWNEINIPIEEKYFDIVYKKVISHLENIPELWIRDCFACADNRYRLHIRIATGKPWMSLFAYNMFLRPTEKDLETFTPDWQIYSAPDLKLDPEACGVRHSNAVLISFRHKMILIAGTAYTGETKKSIFSVLNFLLPQQQVLSMHCSANKGKEGDTAIFFGLSGTGKTTLSADPNRCLIGDDEHGWAEDTIFNFEGGCYAKAINLSEEKEPEIFHAIRSGALVENVTFFPGTNKINYEDASITPNTRVSYPIFYVENAAEPSVGSVPNHIFFLTCDAFGVLPPISKLSAPQAMYQFISGYTAKVAGTETGITEPKPTFSACFGSPFLPLHPGRYAAMLGQKIKKHQVSVWLVNTGWTGGPYGTGSRIQLKYTRAMITAALEGKLADIATETDPVFGLAFPLSCPGTPAEMLNPRNTWADKNAYDKKAKYLAGLFNKNFEKYRKGVSSEIMDAAPKE